MEWASHPGKVDPNRQDACALILLLALSLYCAFFLLRPVGFHNDEYLTLWRSLAFYHGDWWLRSVDAQKPPLQYLIIAAIWRVAGMDFNYAQIPALWASCATPLLVYAIGVRLFTSKLCGLLAGASVALSNLQVLFAPTLFLDPLYIALACLAWHYKLEARIERAALFFVLALATKQQAVMFLPLLAVGSPSAIWSRSNFNFFAWLILGVGLLLLWSLIGHGTELPFISQQIAGETAASGGLFAPVGSWGLRCLQWWQLLRLSFSDAWICILALASPALLQFCSKLSSRQKRNAWLLLLWCLVWLAFLLVVNFRLIERYLLPLVPVTGLLLGALLSRIDLNFKNNHASAILRSLLAFCCLACMALGLRTLPARAQIANFRTLSFYYLHFPSLAGLLHEIPTNEPRQVYATPQLFPAVYALLYERKIVPESIRQTSWPLRLPRDIAKDSDIRRFLLSHSMTAADRFSKRLPPFYSLSLLNSGADGACLYEIITSRSNQLNSSSEDQQP